MVDEVVDVVDDTPVSSSVSLCSNCVVVVLDLVVVTMGAVDDTAGSVAEVVTVDTVPDSTSIAVVSVVDIGRC